MNKVVVFYTRFLILLSFVLFPYIYLKIFLRGRERKEDEHMRILVAPQLTRIGDLVATTPVFRAIKKRYPNSFVSVVSSANAAGIIKHNPWIDEIIEIEDYQNDFFGLLKKIRKEKFYAGISLSGSALSSVIFFYGFIPARIKITRSDRPLAESLSDWMCTITESYRELSYLPLFYLKILRHLDINSSDDTKEVFLNEVSNARIADFFAKENILSSDVIIGLSLTAGNKVKEWGDDNFEALIRGLRKKYDIKIVFIGAQRERERVDAMIKKIGDPNCINASGFSIEDLPSLMRRFSVFIAVDTGPIHVAHALGIPLIDILGPVNDIELTPKGKNIKILKPDPYVPPTIFAFKESGDKELTQLALRSMRVDQVIAAFVDLSKGTFLREAR